MHEHKVNENFAPAPRGLTAHAIVCASCPTEHQNEASLICRQQKIMRAFGQSGSWCVEQWENQVLIAVVGLVEERDAERVRILCIEDAEHCEEQMAAQKRLIQSIRSGLGDPSFPIRVEWMPFVEFQLEFAAGCGSISTSSAQSKANSVESPAAQHASAASGVTARPAHARVRSHSRTDRRRRGKHLAEDPSAHDAKRASDISADCGGSVAAQASCDRTIGTKKENGKQAWPERPPGIEQGSDPLALQGGSSQKQEDWPDLLQASTVSSSGTSRLRKPSAAGRCSSSSRSSSQPAGAGQGRTRGMQPRRNPLGVVWSCPECKTRFLDQESLVDHQQSEGHWSATLEDSGRTFVRKWETSNATIRQGPEDCRAPVEDPDPNLTSAVPEGCMCFSLDSPRHGAVDQDDQPGSNVLLAPVAGQEQAKAAETTHAAAKPPNLAKAAAATDSPTKPGTTDKAGATTDAPGSASNQTIADTWSASVSKAQNPQEGFDRRSTSVPVPGVKGGGGASRRSRQASRGAAWRKTQGAPAGGGGKGHGGSATLAGKGLPMNRAPRWKPKEMF